MGGLSIILVNFRTARLTLDCLRTVFAETRDTEFEVIVADNDSGDDSRTLILGAFPQVRWIDMGYNAGFARANNRAMREARGDCFLLLNTDTLVIDRALDRCYVALAASDFVACGVQLLNADGSPQISGNYFVRGGLNYLLPLPCLGRVVRAVAKFAGARTPHAKNEGGTIEVDWINGAFLMARRGAVEKAGLLDEDFFLYAEETEWCSRLRKQGRCGLFADIRVIHLQGETSGQTFGTEARGYVNLNDRRGRQIMLSNLVRIRKQYGIGWFAFMLAAYTVEIPFFGLAVAFRSLRAAPRYRSSDWRGFARNVGFVWKLSPVIVRNRPYFYKVL